MRIALLLRKVRHCDGAVATRLVEDLHAHGQELLLLHHQRHRAREEIAAATWACVHDHLDRTRGLIALRSGRQRKHRAKEDERYSKARRRHAFTLLDNGMSRTSPANNSITAEIGLATRMERLPSDIISDWRSARSIGAPSTSARM